MYDRARCVNAHHTPWTGDHVKASSFGRKIHYSKDPTMEEPEVQPKLIDRVSKNSGNDVQVTEHGLSLRSGVHILLANLTSNSLTRTLKFNAVRV